METSGIIRRENKGEGKGEIVGGEIGRGGTKERMCSKWRMEWKWYVNGVLDAILKKLRRFAKWIKPIKRFCKKENIKMVLESIQWVEGRDRRRVGSRNKEECVRLW